jgi:hypothetical protein
VVETRENAQSRREHSSMLLSEKHVPALCNVRVKLKRE